MIYTLENLEVFTLSESFADKIWFEVIKWKYFEKDTVGKQLVKSADSISANIAEGYGRYPSEKTHGFCISLAVLQPNQNPGCGNAKSED